MELLQPSERLIEKKSRLKLRNQNDLFPTTQKTF